MIPNLFPTQPASIHDAFQIRQMNNFQIPQQQTWQYTPDNPQNNFNNNFSNLFSFGQQQPTDSNNRLFSAVGNTLFNSPNAQQTITITLQYGSQKELVVLERTQDPQVISKKLIKK